MDCNEHDNGMWYSKGIGNFNLLTTDTNVFLLLNFIRFATLDLL